MLEKYLRGANGVKRHNFIAQSRAHSMKSAPRETEKDQKDEVLASLARVLEICFATASDRHRRLIQYLVTEELEGRGDRLKALSIAIDVLGRSADFNPQTDSVVRVEMGRIRQALDLYYATQGANDPVRIKFEKGSYRPKFARVSKVEPARVAWRLRLLITAVAVAILVGAAFVFLPVGKKPADRRASPVSIGGPRVAVAPIKFSADKPDWDYLASGLQGEMVGILAEFDWLTVFPIFAGEPIDKAIMERIDYVVHSSAQVANANIAIWVLLSDGKTGAVLWSNRYESPLEGAGLFDLQRKIAIRIASDIGRPRGIVASLEKTHIANDSFKSPEGFDCYLHALRFYTTYEIADYYDAQDCAEKASKALPADANVLALVALLELAGASFGYDGPPSPERRIRAAKIADQAYRINDLGSLPRTASYIAALCVGDEERFRTVAAQALRDYPNNPAVLFDVAQRFILGTSDRSEGVALLERAHELLPVENSSYGVLSAFVEFQHSLDKEAILKALNLRSAKLSPPLQLIEMVLRARMGDASGAERMRQSLQALGFTQRSAYLDLVERQCWTKPVKEIVGNLLPDKLAQP